jgi:hypothetical protein
MTTTDAGAAFDALTDDEMRVVLGNGNGSHMQTESAGDLDGWPVEAPDDYDPSDLAAIQRRECELAERVYDGAPHPADLDGQPGAAPVEVARTVADIGAEFWPAKPVLEHIRTSAYARLASPWATLGEVLARALTFIPPAVQLPPIIGGNGSLNLFVAQVATPGVGKGAAARAAKDAMGFRDEVKAVPVGTGEGIIDTFQTTDTKGEPTWHTRAAMVTIPEVDHLAAEMSRTSSTIGAYLRQGFMGEGLGAVYRTKTSRAFLPDHSYRLTLTVGVQPGRAGALLAESAGGTPQRFIWLPATDPLCPDVTPEMPKAWEWRPPARIDLIAPDHDGAPVVLTVCEAARETIVSDQRARQREQIVDPLETHSNFVRLKVAAALSILCYDERADGPMPGITDEYWNLAGLVMEVSSLTRRKVCETLSAEVRAQNEAAGYAEASRAEIVENAAEARKIRKTCDRIRTKLTDRPVEWSHSDLRAQIDPAYRDYFLAALERLVTSGAIVRRGVEYHGSTGWRYRLAGLDEG